MVWMGGKFSLWLCLTLITQTNLSRGLEDANFTDIQSFLDNSYNPENYTDTVFPDLNDIFESSRDNDTNELVIKKNLYIFPVNAPDLLISHKHEIHAVRVDNATNSTDEEPVTELQDIHEISLSKLLPLNQTDYENLIGNETVFGTNLTSNLEIVSGFEPGTGLVTKEIPLPPLVSKGITLPQNSISDLLSSLNETAQEANNPQSTETPNVAKREAEPESAPLQLSRTDFSSTLSQNPSTENSLVTGLDTSALSNKRKSLIEDEEDMDVAEDIVFRPLFRYRQETRLRPHDRDYARYSSTNRRRNGYRYSNYDNYEYSRYRDRPRPRTDDDYN